MKPLTIGALAKQTGLNLETLRFYERRGLLPKPPRSRSGYRLYPNIGYIKIRIFPGAVGIDLAKDIDRAVAEIADCERLIIDLRGNTGGESGGCG
jgi:C-terminal processing protease CtpA/Prc